MVNNATRHKSLQIQINIYLTGNYPMDSAIQPSNAWGRVNTLSNAWGRVIVYGLLSSVVSTSIASLHFPTPAMVKAAILML